jgi:hypothetical protein
VYRGLKLSSRVALLHTHTHTHTHATRTLLITGQLALDAMQFASGERDEAQDQFPPPLPLPPLRIRFERGDVENYLRDSAGPRSLVFDLSIAHDRFGSSSHVLQNGLLTHPQDLDGPLQRKINACRQQYADNQNISVLPAIMSTSCRMHGEFLRLIFYRPTGRPRRTHCSWNVIAKLPNGRVPFQAHGVPSVPEEQDRPSSLQSGGVEDQPQYPGL